MTVELPNFQVWVEFLEMVWPDCFRLPMFSSSLLLVVAE
jgi:hypothetical protein